MKKLLKNKVFKILILVNIILFAGVYIISNQCEKGTMTAFTSGLKENSIEAVSIVEDTSNIVTIKYVTKEGKYALTTPQTPDLLDLISKSKVNVKAEIGISVFQTFVLFSLGIIGSSYMVLLFLRRKDQKELASTMTNSMMSGGMGMFPQDKKEKSIAKSVKSTTKLADVAGCEEEKLEVTEIIDFLKNPKKYTEIGATIPKGILLVGPPGTGKTLLAKAIAGEANVDFLSVSGSDFIEKFVGVGAKRVRDIMEQAQKKAPCIVFIDEVDAIGKQRDGGSNGNDERDQTLNQLLVEMDGMDENAGVIIIAATNRPEILDRAFLRKGRFDRKIAINLPDTKGREDILRVHAKKKRISETVDMRDIAKKTHGYSGADLYAVLNEAALLAIRTGRNEILTEDIDEGIDRVMMGHSRKSKKYSEEDKAMIAYHETGHVVLGLKLNEANKIDKVTIIPRGDAGGYALLSPKEDKFLHTKENLLEQICGLLAGRAAEELIFNKITTGAHNDLEKATNIARSMITEYGMSELGLAQVEQGKRNYSGYSSGSNNYSDRLAYEIDQKINEILKNCYTTATNILKSNKSLLDELAQILQEEETLTSEQIKVINDKHSSED